MKSGSIFLRNSTVGIICWFLSMGQARAQLSQVPNPKDLKEITTPSPNAAALGEYGNVPVGLYTGSATVDVPIYEVDEGALKLPISMSYKTGGTKIAEFATSTGLGWTLNAGGVITRTIYGLPDEGRLSVNNYTIPLQATFGQAKEALLNNVDYQPDIFYFNFNGRTGKFILSQTNDILISPHQNLRIQATNASNGNGVYLNPPFTGMGAITGFRITDETGVIYEFKDVETSQLVGTYNPLTTVTTIKQIGTMPAANSAWYLSNIYSPTGDTIRLSYGNYILDYDMPSSEQQYVQITGSGQDYTYNGATFLAPPPSQSNLFLAGAQGALGYSSPQPRLMEVVAKYQTFNKRLQQISFSNGTVVFTMDSARFDLIGDTALDHISVYKKNGQLLKEYALHYQYVGAGGGLTYGSQMHMNAVSDNTYATWASDVNSPNSSSLRIMLTGVSELDSSGADIGKNYQFTYDFTYGSLPDRFSKARDYWGYSNGGPNNESSFLNFQLNGTNAADPSEYLITGSDPSLNYCKQNSLMQVTYPTGGTSQFNYALHDAFLGPQVIPPPVVAQSCTMVIDYSNYANLTYNDTTINGLQCYYSTFNINGTSAAVNIAINNMMYQGNGIKFLMRFDIYTASGQSFLTMDQIVGDGTSTYQDIPGNGTTYRVYNYTLNGYNFPNGSYMVIFTPLASFIGNNNYMNTYLANASCVINGWSNIIGGPTTINVTRNIGGLRLASTVDSDPISGQSLQKNYAYTYAGQTTSSGHLVSGLSYVYPYNQIYQGSDADDNSIYAMFSYMVVNGESNYPLSTTQGSNVGYSVVTVTETDPVTGNVNGKSENYYTFYNDQYAMQDGPVDNYPFAPPDDRDWLRGLLMQKIDYKYANGAFSPVKNETYNYAPPILLDAINGYTARYAQEYMLGTTDTTSIIGGPDPNSPFTELIGGTGYTYTSGYMPLTSKSVTTVADDGTSLTTTTNYIYADAPSNMLPTQVSTSDSKGETITTRMSYPMDYSVVSPTTSAASGLLNLQQAHIIAPVVEQTVQRMAGNGNNIGVVSGTYTTFKPTQALQDSVFSLETNSPLVSYSPVSVNPNTTVMDAHYVPFVSYGSYDGKGNLLQQTKINDYSLSYLWDYNGKYLIADVKNARASDIAYTSFEADASGNWVIPDATRNGSTAITGGQSYNLNGGNTITASGLSAGTTYIVSYWSTGGSLSVNGTSGTAGTQVGGWTYYEHQVTGASGVSVSGTSTIDELRLFPKGAKMTTYTYVPLVGMSSQCSPANYVTYYVYDGLQRLKLIKDMRGNIIKTIDYHYQGQ